MQSNAIQQRKCTAALTKLLAEHSRVFGKHYSADITAANRDCFNLYCEAYTDGCYDEANDYILQGLEMFSVATLAGVVVKEPVNPEKLIGRKSPAGFKYITHEVGGEPIRTKLEGFEVTLEPHLQLRHTPKVQLGFDFSEGDLA